MLSTRIFITLLTLGYVQADYVYKDDIYDASFWEGFDKEEKPYEHDWKHIPDFIDKPNVYFWFNMTHHFLNGIDRGVYFNDTLEIDPQCFGEKYVIKINELAAMFKDNFFYNIIPALAIFYQLWYMLTQQCSFDQTINDLFLFCWNDNCEFMTILEHTYMNFLYMTRALIDAAIVWFEGLEGQKDEDGEIPNESYWELSRQTGETIAEIIKEIINFQQQDKFHKRPVIIHEQTEEEENRIQYTPEELVAAQEEAAKASLEYFKQMQAAAKLEDEGSLDAGDEGDEPQTAEDEA